MHMMRSLKRAGRVAGALLGVVGLVAMAGSGTAAAENDVNLCPADRPCITELYVKTNGVLFARWSGNSERYNIEVTAPGALTKTYDVEREFYGWTLPQEAWGHTYRVSIQGCDSGGLFQRSDCTEWAAREIFLDAPSAPTNVRLNGNTVTWDRLDSLTFHAQLRGTRKSDGEHVYIDHRDEKARSIELPAGWRDQYSAIRICASNPGGRRCTEISVATPASQLPKAPATPANFKGERQNGFGTRIFLSWSDTSNEEYYYLTAVSAQTGEIIVFPLSTPAPKLGANSTAFIESGQITAVVGGVEFRLQACNAGGCSAPAKVVVQ
jgi:hypothetical protein